MRGSASIHLATEKKHPMSNVSLHTSVHTAYLRTHPVTDMRACIYTGTCHTHTGAHTQISAETSMVIQNHGQMLLGAVLRISEENKDQGNLN